MTGRAGWEGFIPAVAFKNAGSSYFGRQPFRLVLPDLGGLYDQINTCPRTHLPRPLGRAPDPGTFFVKTMKATSKSAAYDQNTFYEAGVWRSRGTRSLIRTLAALAAKILNKAWEDA